MTAVPRRSVTTDDRPDNPGPLPARPPEARDAGPGGHGAAPGPMPPRPCPARPGPAPPRGAVDAAAPMDAKSAPTGAWKTAKNAVSHSAHNPSSFFIEIWKSTGPASRTGAEHSSRSVPPTGPRTGRGPLHDHHRRGLLQGPAWLILGACARVAERHNLIVTGGLPSRPPRSVT